MPHSKCGVRDFRQRYLNTKKIVLIFLYAYIYLRVCFFFMNLSAGLHGASSLAALFLVGSVQLDAV